MKKKTKIALLTVGIVTLILLIAAVMMLNVVLGDALFYMNSTLGRICAVSYRWVCLTGGLLVVFWGVFALKLYWKIKQERLEKEAVEKSSEPEEAPKSKKAPKSEKVQKSEEVPKPAAPLNILRKEERVCKVCGNPLSAKSKFCPSCGNKVDS